MLANIKRRPEPWRHLTFLMPETDTRRLKEMCRVHNWVFSDMVRHALLEFEIKVEAMPKPKQQDLPFGKST